MCDQIVWESVGKVVDSHIDANQFHVWPFSHSFPIDVRFLMLDRQKAPPLHRPDHLEVFFIESGKAGYEVDGNVREIKKNDVVVVNEKMHHRSLPAPSCKGGARIAVLSFLPQLLHSGSPTRDDLQCLMPFSMLGTDGPTVPNVITGNPSLSRSVFDFMQRVLSAMPEDNERSRLAIRTYMRMILFTLTDYYWDMRDVRGAAGRVRDDMKRLAPAFEYVEKHYGTNVRVQAAARLCAMSPTCFTELFKRLTRHSFAQYLKHFRVNRAKEMLIVSAQSISEIGQATGFCDQSHFGAVFRQVTGMTPLAFRQSKSWVDLST
jgi:AraC-like DNA-binding protein